MEFNKSYNRAELLSFLRTKFLPEDFVQEESVVEFATQTKYSTRATRLGSCASLDLVVYEIRHRSRYDARVGMSKEAFRLLAEEYEDRALVFFVPEDSQDNYRLSLIEITLEVDNNSAKINRKYSNPHRYSYYLGKGIAYHTPNEYLNEKGRVLDIDDLHNRFSVDVLTKAFYQELSDWYAWAIKIVKFPNDLKTLEDNQKYNSEAMIRLITRLIFVWFLKQRHLVPDEFFDEQYIANNLIKDFTPHDVVDLFGKSYDSKYYKGVLQNLFFAMLNSPITPEGKNTISERRFRKGRGDYDNNKLMRHEDLFIYPDKFVELANKYVPFLNGGLFDCLDNKDKGIYVDAFTDRKEISDQLVIPDFLFFGEEAGKGIDLSEWYGDKKKKKVSARGIIDILKRYNFTVEENTPFDQEVSLDPELLGKVFENLLAAYNPETQTTARKQTGSFYTPREIVQYMVDESLIAHLKRTVGENIESEYRKLLQYTDEELKLTDDQKKQIVISLYNCKILDPACGSGAFPMGMLQQMVHILNRIDPNNVQWKEMMRNNAISDTSEAYRTASNEERAEIIADIERSFDESINRPDYARKLYLIENCIYGVDIQPIAIQISKLRFFISLVVDQITNTNAADNFGIRPLPNLEAKFVAANTLIGLEKKEANLFDSPVIKQKEIEMKDAKHRIFSAKTVRTKRKYKERVALLRKEMADLLEENSAVGNLEAQQLREYDMFDQNSSSSFFDPEWMFDVKGGFDIIIANPPYINANDLKKSLGLRKYKCLKSLFNTAKGTVDFYVYFFEKGICLLKPQGVLTYITPNKYLSANYGKALRLYFYNNTQILYLLDVSRQNIFDASIYPVILSLIKQPGKSEYVFSAIDKFRIKRYFSSQQLIALPNMIWGFLLSSKYRITKKVIDKCEPITNVCKINATSTASEADSFHDLISENGKGLKLVNTGTIDPFVSLWGERQLIDKGCKYMYPFLPNDKSALGDHRYFMYNAPKIIIAKMSLMFEAFFDEKGKYASINTNCMHTISIRPLTLLGWLHSKMFHYLYECFFEGLKMSGGYLPFTAPYLSCMCIPHRIDDDDDIFNVVEAIINGKMEKKMELDKLCYQKVDLTYDEVLIVDRETPIRREEYENNKV
ncbi:MAG TPA: restriction endonuclease subunit M [Prevotella sp.]|nr:restriction endonuclease subunit M [Prevotella sp.]